MLADVLVNVALYMPLGMAAYLTFRRRRAAWLSTAAAVILGTVLSASVEMAQLFTPSRNCSALDLLNNAIGSALGAILGALFESFAPPVHVRHRGRAALALLFVWVGSLLFPLFPVIAMPILKRKILDFGHSPLADYSAILSACACWFAAGCLLAASGARRVWLGLSLLLIPMQIVILSRQPVRAEMAGAYLGAILFFLLGNRPAVLRAVPWIFLTVLAIRGLAPFHFAGRAHPFLWVPFRGFLDTAWQNGIQLLLEKVFYYGTAVWLLRAVLNRWLPATLIVSATLAVIEICQQWLPGRTSEITDPLLALLTAAGLWALQHAADSRNVTPA